MNQKLASQRLPQIKDVVSDLGAGDTLQHLIQILSEKEMPRTSPKKVVMSAAAKAQQLENVANVLKFIFDCGVEMKLKPSAENVIKGDRRDVSHLVLCLIF